MSELHPLARSLASLLSERGRLEYALLSALWEQSPATVRDLHRHYRTTPYTTMTAALDRLYKKGLIRRERATRLNAYSPTMSRQELEAAIVDSVRMPPGSLL